MFSFTNTYPYLNPCETRTAILRLRTDSFDREERRTWAASAVADQLMRVKKILNLTPMCGLRRKWMRR